MKIPTKWNYFILFFVFFFRFISFTQILTKHPKFSVAAVISFFFHRSKQEADESVNIKHYNNNFFSSIDFFFAVVKIFQWKNKIVHKISLFFYGSISCVRVDLFTRFYTSIAWLSTIKHQKLSHSEQKFMYLMDSHTDTSTMVGWCWNPKFNWIFSCFFFHTSLSLFLVFNTFERW